MTQFRRVTERLGANAYALSTSTDFKGSIMPFTTFDRLQYGTAVLSSLEARRARTGNPDLHQQVERNIIDRELQELAEEWRQNPVPARTPQADRLK